MQLGVGRWWWASAYGRMLGHGLRQVAPSAGDSARQLQWRASSVHYGRTSERSHCVRTGGAIFSYLAFSVSGSLLNSASQRS